MLITRISVYARIWSSILLINTKSIMVPHLSRCSCVLNSNTLFLKFKTVKFYQFVRYMWRCFKNANPFDLPVFLSMGISTLQFWRRYSIDLSPNNSFISSSVTFGFKFPTYNFLQFCFSCCLDWYFAFEHVGQHHEASFDVCFAGAVESFL